MALNNSNFTGKIGDVSIVDFANRLDYNINDLDRRIELVEDILSLDEIGSTFNFWQDVWDTAQCKSNINKSDGLWSDSNVATLLESFGTYLLSKYENNEEDKRFHRPRGLTELNEDCEVARNDKNYRLDPPEEIHSCDYSLRKVYSKDYNYYKDVLYVEYIEKIKDKVRKHAIDTYGMCDEKFEFSCGKLMSEETWNNIRRLEEQKIILLKDARDNLNVLKNQNTKIQNGGLCFRYSDKEKTKLKRKAEIYKYDMMNRIVPSNVQLARSGYNNEQSKKIEERCLYVKRERSLNVGLRHIVNNISDIKDYMIMCKLAYNNRVPLDAGKNSSKIGIMDYVDYSNPYHIEAILYMECEEITYESDMSIIAYDITKAIRELREEGELDSKDIHIIDGIRHNITQESISKELDINVRTVYRRMDKIIEKTVDKLENIKKVS